MQQDFRLFALDIFRLCIWLALLIVVFVPLERLFTLHPQRILRKSIITDLAYYFISSLAPQLLLILPVAVLAWALHFLVPAGIQLRAAGLPGWLRVGAALLVAEIGFYWGHRWSHEIPLLWRFHAIHHSAEDMDWLVNTRAHPIDMVFTRLCGLVPLYVLGLAQPAAKTLDFVSLLILFSGTFWGFFVHANVKWRLGALEWLISTPAFHHWHHTFDGPINKNYSPLLPFVDVLFGTHHAQKDLWPARYGTESEVPSTLAAQIIGPLLPRMTSRPVDTPTHAGS